MTTLYLDFETYSGIDLKTSSVYKYVENDDATVLSIGFAFDDEPVYVLPGVMPNEWVAYLNNRLPTVTDVVAHNLSFDWVVLKSLFEPLNPQLHKMQGVTMHCTATAAWIKELPGKLKELALTLGVSEKTDTDQIKHKTFPFHLIPNNPSFNARAYNELVEYNKQDVVTLREVHKKLGPMTVEEITTYKAIQKINATGVPVSLNVNAWGRHLCNFLRAQGEQAFSNKKLPNIKKGGFIQTTKQAGAIKDYFNSVWEEASTHLHTLDKKYIAWFKTTDIYTRCPQEIKDVLTIIDQSNYTAYTKFEKVASLLSPDNRLRGAYIPFATVLGRAASRGVNIQNLIKSKFDEDTLQYIHNTTLPDSFTSIDPITLTTVGNVCQRGQFYWEPGFYHGDFNKVEPWLCGFVVGDDDFMYPFLNGLDPYIQFVANALGIPYQTVTAQQRGDIGKPGVISFTYGCSANTAYEANKQYGVTLGAMEFCKQIFTQKHPLFKAFHYKLERVVKQVINTGCSVYVPFNAGKSAYGVTYYKDGNDVCCLLPSGRSLRYKDLSYSTEGNLTYKALAARVDGVKGTGYVTQYTYSSKLFQNLIQAIAADCLHMMVKKYQRYGFEVCMITHDEIVTTKHPTYSHKDFLNLIETPCYIDKEGYTLSIGGYQNQFYHKD